MISSWKLIVSYKIQLDILIFGITFQNSTDSGSWELLSLDTNLIRENGQKGKDKQKHADTL